MTREEVPGAGGFAVSYIVNFLMFPGGAPQPFFYKGFLKSVSQNKTQDVAFELYSDDFKKFTYENNINNKKITKSKNVTCGYSVSKEP